jgi:hypothetical protein
MIEGAERDGLIFAGDTVVEYTGGSTGPALALVCRAKGYQALIVIADGFTEERFQLMRALGAELDVLPPIEGPPKVTCPRTGGDRVPRGRHWLQVHECHPVRRGIGIGARPRGRAPIGLGGRGAKEHAAGGSPCRLGCESGKCEQDQRQDEEHEVEAPPHRHTAGAGIPPSPAYVGS